MSVLFTQQMQAFFNDFGDHRTMVLSTSHDNIVTSRMMSVVVIDGSFFFQTDTASRKYHQLQFNTNVALCIDNIQVEGVCKNLGHTTAHPTFLSVFQKSFKGSYDAYSLLKNERVFEVKPTRIQKWVYEEGNPFIQKYDCINMISTKTPFNGC